MFDSQVPAGTEQKNKFGFDEQCGDLAAYFLPDEQNAEKIKELAQHIQDSIEDWLISKEMP